MRELSIALVEVQPIPHHETVWDRKAHELDRDVMASALGLAEETNGPQASRSLLHDVCAQRAQGKARIDDVFDDEDVASGGALGFQVPGDRPAGAARCAVALKTRKVDRDGVREGPHEVSGEHHAAAKDPDDVQNVVGRVGGIDVVRQSDNPRLNLVG